MGYLCNQLSDYSQNKEILDGRVKTLNSSLYASILYDRNNLDHKKEVARLKFPNIEFVIVNFYPFEKEYLSSGIKKNLVENWINQSIEKAKKNLVRGKDLTPFLISEINKLSKNKTLEANTALIINNALLAGKISKKFNS